MTEKLSESTSLREAIAKLLHADGQGVEWDTEYPSMKRRYLGLASEILEVLADPPADVIEQAAEGGVVERFPHEVEVLRAENQCLHRIVEVQAGRLAEQQIEQGGEP